MPIWFHCAPCLIMSPPKIDGKAGHGDENQNKDGFYNSGRCSASAAFQIRFKKDTFGGFFIFYTFSIFSRLTCVVFLGLTERGFLHPETRLAMKENRSKHFERFQFWTFWQRVNPNKSEPFDNLLSLQSCFPVLLQPGKLQTYKKVKNAIWSPDSGGSQGFFSAKTIKNPVPSLGPRFGGQVMFFLLLKTPDTAAGRVVEEKSLLKEMIFYRKGWNKQGMSLETCMFVQFVLL